MCITKFIKSFVMLCLFLALVACSDGGIADIQGNSSPAVLSGQVADGYLSGARVFLDRNGNQRLDSGEPWTESGAQGHYSLDVQNGDGDRYPVVAEIIAGQTIDEDQAHLYVAESYRLTAPAGRWSFVSPLTTLIKSEMDKRPALSPQDAENIVKSQFGLAGSISLFKDYVNDNDLEYAHRAARIIAGLMGGIQSGIELNVGASYAESQRAAVALMISDQVVNNCDAIAQALAMAEDSTAIEEILTGILSEIDTFKLDSELLARYVERMQSPGSVWDMTPPEITSQRPAAGGSASVDVTVSIALDEEIDAETLTGTSVQVFGPTGPVHGVVSYDSSLKQINFIPDSYLTAFSPFQVVIAGINDQYGNPLDQSQEWNFTTIFDQLPPELPEF